MDSGASEHIFRDKNLAEGVKPSQMVIETASKDTDIDNLECGSIPIQIGEKKLKSFDKVLFSDKMSDNLVSVGKFVRMVSLLCLMIRRACKFH